MKIIIPDEVILDKIYLLRKKKVMVDRDLAKLYNVETKVLKQAVRRNRDRFPEDFMFELSNEEFAKLRSFCDLKLGRVQICSNGVHRKGVAMISSVLNSKAAIQVNILIIRVFTK